MICAQGGGLKKSYNKMAQDEYCRRIEHYCELSVIDAASRQLANYARFEEGARVLLDPRGQEITSHELSERLQDLMNMGTRKLSFFHWRRRGVQSRPADVHRTECRSPPSLSRHEHPFVRKADPAARTGTGGPPGAALPRILHSQGRAVRQVVCLNCDDSSHNQQLELSTPCNRLQQNQNSPLTNRLWAFADTFSQHADRLSTSSESVFSWLSRHLPELPIWGQLVIALQVVHARVSLIWLSTRHTRSIRSRHSCRNLRRSHRTLLHSRHPRRREHGQSSPVGIPRRSQGMRQTTLCRDRTSGRPSRS